MEICCIVTEAKHWNYFPNPVHSVRDARGLHPHPSPTFAATPKKQTG